MRCLKKILSILFFLFVVKPASAQVAAFSLSTDAGVLRSFSEGQRFWAFGQTVWANFHFDTKWTGYAAICYYTNGRFKNRLTATAKDSAQPARLDYAIRSNVRFRQLSLGFKYYLKGGYNNEESWNLYGVGGFGLLFGSVENFYSQTIDSSEYSIPQQSLEGSADFKRLTLDLGLGAEALLGASVYLYADLRTWIPASDFPSPYLYNNNMPRNISVSGGIRVLFD
jgi:hypothetical protein